MKFFLWLAVLVHGCFALAVQAYFPNGLASIFAHKKTATLHSIFPTSIYPPNGPYLTAIAQIVVAFLMLKKAPRR